MDPLGDAYRITPQLRAALVDFWSEGARDSEDLAGVLWRLDLDVDKYPKSDRARVLKSLVDLGQSTRAREAVEALIDLLVEREVFDSETDYAARRIDRLKAAIASTGGDLNNSGTLTWPDEVAAGGQRAGTTKKADRPTQLATFLSRKVVPSGDRYELLEQVLQSVPKAARPLTHYRYAGRPRFDIADEYDWQALVENALRLVFQNVVPEDPLSKTGSASTRIDFWLPHLKCLIEVKHSRPGRGRSVAEEITNDLPTYGSVLHGRDVERVYYVVYDSNASLKEPLNLKDLVETTPNANESRNCFLHVPVSDPPPPPNPTP